MTGLTNGVAYQFTVNAVNAAGTGPVAPWADASPSTMSPPLAPGDLKVTVSSLQVLSVVGTGGKIDLHWSKPAAGGCSEQEHAGCTVSGYTLSYDAQVTKVNAHGAAYSLYGPETATFAATATSGTVESLLNLDNDTFDLVANNRYGHSAPAEVMVPLELVPKAPLVQAFPGAGQVSLTWADNTTTDTADAIGPMSYSVYYGTSATKQVQATGAEVSFQSTSQSHNGRVQVDITATVTGLSELTRYYFHVVGTDAAGPGPGSATLGVTTFGPPGAPSGLSAKAGNRQVLLTWQPPTSDGGSPLTGYDVFMGTSPGGEGATAVASTTATSALVHQDPATVHNGTKYYFTVKALNSTGAGTASGEVSATPEAGG